MDNLNLDVFKSWLKSSSWKTLHSQLERCNSNRQMMIYSSCLLVLLFSEFYSKMYRMSAVTCDSMTKMSRAERFGDRYLRDGCIYSLL